MKKMYRGVTNSPKTELVALITETDTEIEVNDISVLLPNEGIAVIGNGDVAETIKYSQVEGNILKDCIRGYEGIARSWTAGTRVARNFAASDWNTAIDNIEGLYGRLDDEKTVPLTLQPGLQVVTSAKDARFKLGQITGKTEINGQGRTGIVG
ncbi:MAG: phage tail protein, partial [Paenibacillus macerans]|nr:phage tail protein [Paenibacillus macerans]